MHTPLNGRRGWLEPFIYGACYRLHLCFEDIAHIWKIANKDELPLDHLVNSPPSLITRNYN
ncbi:hypothetical protein EMIT0P74_100247 [Pseudomonas sp. IT-P74]